MDSCTIKFIQRGASFKVQPDNVILIPGVALHEIIDSAVHKEFVKTDEGELSISGEKLTFTGKSIAFSIPLRDILRMKPDDNMLDIYGGDRRRPYRFVWGENIIMELVGVPGDDGKIKPLSGRIIGQFIINERTRLGNILRRK
jgi:hypothetical protein